MALYDVLYRWSLFIADSVEGQTVISTVTCISKSRRKYGRKITHEIPVTRTKPTGSGVRHVGLSTHVSDLVCNNLVKPRGFYAVVLTLVYNHCLCFTDQSRCGADFMFSFPFFHSFMLDSASGFGSRLLM